MYIYIYIYVSLSLSIYMYIYIYIYICIYVSCCSRPPLEALRETLLHLAGVRAAEVLRVCDKERLVCLCFIAFDVCLLFYCYASVVLLCCLRKAATQKYRPSLGKRRAWRAKDSVGSKCETHTN